MSRIGKKPILVPTGVTVNIADDNIVTVKGPNGELSKQFSQKMNISLEENNLVVKRPSDSKLDRTYHGTTRALLNNMIMGVSTGFKKELTIVGTGYRAQLKGNKLVVNAGYSNPVEKEIPDGIKVECPKNTIIVISGADKELVGEFAANIRGIRQPEPYLGKGIRYTDEYVRRKEGKTA